MHAGRKPLLTQLALEQLMDAAEGHHFICANCDTSEAIKTRGCIAPSQRSAE
jgi:hypothetical protein